MTQGKVPPKAQLENSPAGKFAEVDENFPNELWEAPLKMQESSLSFNLTCPRSRKKFPILFTIVFKIHDPWKFSQERKIFLSTDFSALSQANGDFADKFDNFPLDDTYNKRDY